MEALKNTKQQDILLEYSIAQTSNSVRLEHLENTKSK